MATKAFCENYPGWVRLPIGNQKPEGYTMNDAQRVKKEVESNMRHTRGIKEIKVCILPLGNDLFYVHNESTYETDY